MKKSFVKVISLVLCFTMLFCTGISAGAEGTEVNRISSTFYGDTSTQRSFTWFTAEETDTKIELYVLGIDVTETVTVETSCEEWEGNYVHKAYVSGLTAGITYNYRVGDGETWSDWGSFVTDNGDDIANFIVIADIQASNIENFRKGRKVLDKAFETMPYAEFYANLGDMTNDSTNEEWDLYAEALDEIGLASTTVPIAGNHDSNSGWFEKMFAIDTTESIPTKNGVNYSFDYGNIHFAVVNTNDVIAISNAQLDWLRNDMNSTDKDWKIVLMHKSPYSLGKDIKWPDACYLQESLAAVCDETNVDLVMSGHDHMYVRTAPLYDNQKVEQDEGTTYVLAGTAGSKRYDFRKFIANNYFPLDILDVAVAQSNGEYLADGSLDNLNESYKGGIFNTVSVAGGYLSLKSYVVNDETGEVTQIDDFKITKAQGENEITFTGDNTTSKTEQFMDQLSSFMSLAAYCFTKWLPMFLKSLPDLITTYMETGTF